MITIEDTLMNFSIFKRKPELFRKQIPTWLFGALFGLVIFLICII